MRMCYLTAAKESRPKNYIYIEAATVTVFHGINESLTSVTSIHVAHSRAVSFENPSRAAFGETGSLVDDVFSFSVFFLAL